jgi:hypothetical protein
MSKTTSPSRSAASPTTLALAIAAHRAAQAKVEGMEGHHSDEDGFSAAVDAARRTLLALAETPCVSDADFLAKAAYLVECERRLWGSVPSDETPFGLLALATELHLFTV